MVSFETVLFNMSKTTMGSTQISTMTYIPCWKWMYEEHSVVGPYTDERAAWLFFRLIGREECING